MDIYLHAVNSWIKTLNLLELEKEVCMKEEKFSLN